MFGYIISKKFGESKVWNYASITIFEEVGFDLKLYRGKVFNEEVIDIVKNIIVGDQVQFEVKRITRGTRNYTEFTFIAQKIFRLVINVQKYRMIPNLQENITPSD